MTQSPSQPQGVWAWIWQRITAVLLVVFLGTHIFVLHYVPENLNINFAGVALRFGADVADILVRGRGHRHIHSSKPMASATVWISLSPRPERQTTTS